MWLYNYQLQSLWTEYIFSWKHSFFVFHKMLCHVRLMTVYNFKYIYHFNNINTAFKDSVPISRVSTQYNKFHLQYTLKRVYCYNCFHSTAFTQMAFFHRWSAFSWSKKNPHMKCTFPYVHYTNSYLGFFMSCGWKCTHAETKKRNKEFASSYVNSTFSNILTYVWLFSDESWKCYHVKIKCHMWTGQVMNAFSHM